MTKSLYFTKTMFHCKDQCQESIQKIRMTTGTTQPYSAIAAKVVEKLLRKGILLLENAAILKKAALLDIRSRKI